MFTEFNLDNLMKGATEDNLNFFEDKFDRDNDFIRGNAIRRVSLEFREHLIEVKLQSGESIFVHEDYSNNYVSNDIVVVLNLPEGIQYKIVGEWGENHSLLPIGNELQWTGVWDNNIHHKGNWDHISLSDSTTYKVPSDISKFESVSNYNGEWKSKVLNFSLFHDATNYIGDWTKSFVEKNKNFLYSNMQGAVNTCTTTGIGDGAWTTAASWSTLPSAADDIIQIGHNTIGAIGTCASVTFTADVSLTIAGNFTFTTMVTTANTITSADANTKVLTGAITQVGALALSTLTLANAFITVSDVTMTGPIICSAALTVSAGDTFAVSTFRLDVDATGDNAFIVSGTVSTDDGAVIEADGAIVVTATTGVFGSVKNWTLNTYNVSSPAGISGGASATIILPRMWVSKSNINFVTRPTNNSTSLTVTTGAGNQGMTGFLTVTNFTNDRTTFNTIINGINIVVESAFTNNAARSLLLANNGVITIGTTGASGTLVNSGNFPWSAGTIQSAHASYPIAASGNSLGYSSDTGVHNLSGITFAGAQDTSVGGTSVVIVTMTGNVICSSTLTVSAGDTWAVAGQALTASSTVGIAGTMSFGTGGSLTHAGICTISGTGILGTESTAWDHNQNGALNMTGGTYIAPSDAGWVCKGNVDFDPGTTFTAGTGTCAVTNASVTITNEATGNFNNITTSTSGTTTQGSAVTATGTLTVDASTTWNTLSSATSWALSVTSTTTNNSTLALNASTVALTGLVVGSTANASVTATIAAITNTGASTWGSAGFTGSWTPSGAAAWNNTGAMTITNGTFGAATGYILTYGATITGGSSGILNISASILTGPTDANQANAIYGNGGYLTVMSSRSTTITRKTWFISCKMSGTFPSSKIMLQNCNISGLVIMKQVRNHSRLNARC